MDRMKLLLPLSLTVLAIAYPWYLLNVERKQVRETALRLDSLYAVSAVTDSIYEEENLVLRRHLVQTESQLSDVTARLQTYLSLPVTPPDTVVITQPVITDPVTQDLQFSLRDSTDVGIGVVGFSADIGIVPPYETFTAQVSWFTIPKPVALTTVVSCQNQRAVVEITQPQGSLDITIEPTSSISPDVCNPKTRSWWDRWWIGAGGAAILVFLLR
jgi:hypothetical protein